MQNSIGIKLIALAADAAFFRLSLSPTGEMFSLSLSLSRRLASPKTLSHKRKQKNFTYFFKSILLLFSDVILYKINIL